MNPLEMVVAIVLIVVVGKVLQAKFRAQSRPGPLPADMAETARMRDELRALKERISVLERVITDNHSSVELEREIERLRDQNKV